MDTQTAQWSMLVTTRIVDTLDRVIEIYGAEPVAVFYSMLSVRSAGYTACEEMATIEGAVGAEEYESL